jgi:ABC-type lipoprotein release transport system permease subunit
MSRVCLPNGHRNKVALVDAVRVGFFLGQRQLLRANAWTTALIVFIMTLTFLNLTVVGGILLGLVEGSSLAYQAQYSGDVLVSSLDNKRFITRSQEMVRVIEAQPSTIAVSGRYLQGGTVEANWKEKKSALDKADSVSVRVAGINPQAEDEVTGLADLLIDGRYLESQSSGEILIGSSLLAEYNRAIGDDTLENVKVGDRVRLIVNGQAREMTIRGVVKSKIGEVSSRVFVPERELRPVLGRDDLNVNEIAVRLDGGLDGALALTNLLENRGYGDHGKIETYEEAQGSFFKDVQNTFVILSNFIGSIALVVAAITVFIVILINALSRKREIGIMKGIGICGRAITLAYIIQAVAYAVLGTAIGLLLLYGVIKPYFDANPIDFPFSDGILVATTTSTTIDVVLLLIATTFAGWLPARGIIRQNTLNTILGR